MVKHYVVEATSGRPNSNTNRKFEWVKGRVDQTTKDALESEPTLVMGIVDEADRAISAEQIKNAASSINHTNVKSYDDFRGSMTRKEVFTDKVTQYHLNRAKKSIEVCIDAMKEDGSLPTIDVPVGLVVHAFDAKNNQELDERVSTFSEYLQSDRSVADKCYGAARLKEVFEKTICGLTKFKLPGENRPQLISYSPAIVSGGNVGKRYESKRKTDWGENESIAQTKIKRLFHDLPISVLVSLCRYLFEHSNHMAAIVERTNNIENELADDDSSSALNN